MSDTKRCYKCGETKPVTAFSKNRSKANGRQCSCKSCNKGVNAARALRFPTEKRASHLMRSYGVTLEWFDAQLAKQGYLCGICRRSTPGGHGEWHVDHDHVPGYKTMLPEEKRKHNGLLLCQTCNTHLGIHEKMEADPRVAAYRRKYRKR